MLNIFHFLGYSSAREHHHFHCWQPTTRRGGSLIIVDFCQLKLRWQTRMAARTLKRYASRNFLHSLPSDDETRILATCLSGHHSSFSMVVVLRYHLVFFSFSFTCREGEENSDGFDYLSDRRTSVLGRPNRRTAGGGNTIRSRTSSSWWWRRWLESSIAWICANTNHEKNATKGRISENSMFIDWFLILKGLVYKYFVFFKQLVRCKSDWR